MTGVQITTVDEFWENPRAYRRDSKWAEVYDYGIANAGSVVEVTLEDDEEARRLEMALRAIDSIPIETVQKQGRTIRFKVRAQAE